MRTPEEIAKSAVDANIYALSVQYGRVRSWATLEGVIAAAIREALAEVTP